MLMLPSTCWIQWLFLSPCGITLIASITVPPIMHPPFQARPRNGTFCYVPIHPSVGLFSQPLWLMLMKHEHAWWGSRLKHSIQLCYFCYINCIKTLSWPQPTGLVYTEACSELLWASLKAHSSSQNFYGEVIECMSKREKSLAANYHFSAIFWLTTCYALNNTYVRL